MKRLIAPIAFLAAMLSFHAVRACDNCGVGTGGPIAPTGPGFALAPSYGCYGGMAGFQQRTITTYHAPMVAQQAPVFVQQAPMVGYGAAACGVGANVGYAPVFAQQLPAMGYGASAGPAGAFAGYGGAGAGFGVAQGGFVGGTGRVRSRAVTRTGIFGRQVSRSRFRSR